MPPKSTSSNAARRKGPQFNPPRPVKGATETSAAKKRAAATTSRSAGATKKSKAPATIISSDDEEEDVEEDADSDDLIEMEDAPVRNSTRQPQPVTTAPPIPAPLLARLLYENFENTDTQIQKGAMNLTGKYIEIFVREALARAKNERETAVKDGGISDGFLQVEDLEKLAPQLVLDF